MSSVAGLIVPNNFNLASGGAGDVEGPVSSTDDHVATFDGATGKIIQDSGVRVVSGGTNSFAIGNGASAAGSHAIALGNGAIANLAGSIAIGNGAAVDFTHTYSITGQVLTPVPGGSGTLGSFHNVKINGIDYFVPLYTVAGAIGGGSDSYINTAQTGVGATATPIAVSGTYYKLGLSAANAIENSGWSSDVNGRITYLGAATKIFNVNVVTSLVNIAAGTKNVSIIIYKDGAPVATTASYVDLTSQTDPTHVNTHGLISMATNSYLEVYVTNHTDTNAVAATEFNLLATSVN